jgi:hypothetical protein
MEYYRLTIPIPKRPWDWFRYRIATFLLLVAILAISLAWWQDHRKLTAQLRKLQYPDVSWGVNQVLGAPNTSGGGDLATAWASETPDAQEEWLELEYAKSVVPKAIVIHETYNPGAVFKVTHVPRWGEEQVLWQGTDPTPVGSNFGVSRLPTTASIRTSRIKVYINSGAVGGWNEIDAVGLEYGDNKVIWAEEAKASSSYGTPMRYGPSPYFTTDIF